MVLHLKITKSFGCPILILARYGGVGFRHCKTIWQMFWWKLNYTLVVGISSVEIKTTLIDIDFPSELYFVWTGLKLLILSFFRLSQWSPPDLSHSRSWHQSPHQLQCAQSSGPQKVYWWFARINCWSPRDGEVSDRMWAKMSFLCGYLALFNTIWLIHLDANIICEHLDQFQLCIHRSAATLILVTSYIHIHHSPYRH